MAVTIYYDGECPFCASYVALLRLRESVGRVALVDLRGDAEARARMAALGHDPDLGMVVETGGASYAGSDALNALALLTTPSGVFNRLNAWAFRSAAASRVVYPLMRAGRNLVLTLLGRQPIAGEDAEVMAKFTIFCAIFGLFSIFHGLNSVFEYGLAPSWHLAAVALLGALNVFRPGRPSLFVLLMAASLLSGWLNAPVGSNHTFLRNVLAAGFFAVYGAHLLKGSRWSQVFTDFAALGGALLLVLYTFGIFHKINTGFLDPEVSCAPVLWSLMPPPLSLVQGRAMDLLAIYGTFVVEGLLILALLTRRFRHLGIVGGILFHLMLALSSFSMYLSFTTLAISLHMLYLTPAASVRVLASPVAGVLMEAGRRPARALAVVGILGVVMSLAALREYGLATVVASALFLPLCLAVILRGAERPGERRRLSPVGTTATAVFGIGFFVLCLSPYIGLRNGASMNMFANLRTEGGVSNHLVFREPVPIFPYLSEVVKVEEASAHGYLPWMATNGMLVPYVYMLMQLERHPEARVTFRRGDEVVRDASAASLAADMEALLPPAWARKLLQFEPVHPDVPPPCR